MPDLEQLIELGVAHPLELDPLDDPRVAIADPDLPGDAGRRQAVITGDHDDPDPCPPTSADGIDDLGAGRVGHRHESEQA